MRHLASRHPDLAVAICGRDASRLSVVASEVGWDDATRASSTFVVTEIAEEGSSSGSSSISSRPSKALVEAFANAKIVLACAGPYRRCGLPVLGAAIEAGCDYLDLCGEPQFFDDALLAYDRRARDAGVLAVHAAAFDCVPAELGCALAERALLAAGRRSTGDAGEEEEEDVLRCAGIEVIHTVRNVTSANATTFHAAVDGFHAAACGELASSRNRVREMYPEFDETSPPPRPHSWPKVPETPGAILPGYDAGLNLRTMRFVGADASAIRSSWRYLRSRVPDHPRRGRSVPEPRLSVLMGVDGGDKLSTMRVMAYGATFATLARWGWGCDLLHAYPETFSGGVFTNDGPTEEELGRGGFVTYVTAYGSGGGARGTDGRDGVRDVARVRVSGPEPGYVSTPGLIVALALTLLDARKVGSEGEGTRLPFYEGVTLPGALFGDCDGVYDNMRREGVRFDVVDEFVETEHSPV